MSYMMADFRRDYIKEHLPQLTAEERRDVLASLSLEERRDVLASLPLEERLAGLSEEQIREYLDQRTARQPSKPHKPRRKK